MSEPFEEPEDPDKEKREKIVKQALDTLAEHFEAVILFACYKNGEDSVRYNRGRGNHYTRYGMVRDWVCEQERE